MRRACWNKDERLPDWMAYRVILWDEEVEEFVGYGYHRTRRLAKKHAKQLALAFTGRIVDIIDNTTDCAVDTCYA